MKSQDSPPSDNHRLLGLEVDNLLAFLAHLGLLRALEAARPGWMPRSSWAGPPWQARLHLAATTTERDVAAAAAEGLEAIASHFDADGRANVAFKVNEFRAYAGRVRGEPVGAALASALTAELPEKKAGGVRPAPLVMLFGQGHQNFLDRLVAVPRGDLPARRKKEKPPPNMRDPGKIAEALFAPWKRADDADAFRWDPEEDQRYALRFGDPSDAGAAPTVHGANRLAAIGFLSFPCMPGARSMTTPGVARDADGVQFMWPVWTVPLSRHAIEKLLTHPDLIALRVGKLRPFGVVEIFRARRIANGKFMNVTRAAPVSERESSPSDVGLRRTNWKGPRISDA
jgi:hypothetical protein